MTSGNQSKSYFAFGINHRSAPVEIRESFELSADKIRDLAASTRLPKGTEWIVLSTCNRTEIYLFGEAGSVIDIQAGIERLCGYWPQDHAFVVENDEAVRHIFEVTSGLRSQILGDAQILGQVKDAYRLAASCETVGPRLHRLMHVAFATAKRVISSTALGSGGTSVARSAVNTLEHKLAGGGRSIKDLSVLILGCGNMGVRILKELSARQPGACYLSNRTDDRAVRVASRYGVTAVPWSNRFEAATRADVVFSTTGSNEFVIRREDLNGEGATCPTLFVDISVPRNIDPALAEKSGYTVLNIDQLPTNGDGQAAVRRNVQQAKKLCDEATQGAMGWETQTRAVEPAVRTLHETFETIRSREVERNIHRFNTSDRVDVDRLTRSIMQKLIAIPIVRLKALAESDEDLVDRIELLNSLFDKGACEE